MSILKPGVYAVVDKGDKRQVKAILKSPKVPTGIVYRDGALYVADINKIYRCDDAETNLDKMPEPKAVYDMPPYVPHSRTHLVFDRNGWLRVPFGPQCNVRLRPTSVSQICSTCSGAPDG
jgi:glucose/arabinose dehydrogenase